MKKPLMIPKPMDTFIKRVVPNFDTTSLSLHQILTYWVDSPELIQFEKFNKQYGETSANTSINDSQLLLVDALRNSYEVINTFHVKRGDLVIKNNTAHVYFVEGATNGIDGLEEILLVDSRQDKLYTQPTQEPDISDGTIIDFYKNYTLLTLAENLLV